MLIIEDEPLAALVMRLLSQDCGATSVDIADTRSGAIAAASARRPDIIAADLALGDGGGGEAVRSIREQMGPVPVIYLAGTSSLKGRLTSQDKVLGKPLNERAFVRMLRQLQGVVADNRHGGCPNGSLASL